MLPTQLENLVGHYAYGFGRYNLSEELEYLATNRGMIPDTFLEHCLPLKGHNMIARQTLSCYEVKNPLRTDNPFFPWSLIDKNAIIFSNTFYWWEGCILCSTYRKLKTYRSTFSRHVTRLTHRGRDMFVEWNNFMTRYLQTDCLLDPQNYLTNDHDTMFSLICEQLGNAGYLSPMILLPPRPSRLSVLSLFS